MPRPDHRAAAPTRCLLARARELLLALLLPLVLPALVLLSPPARAQDGVRVLIHPDLATVTLDRDLVRAVFTLRVRNWPNGTPVRVFVLPDASSVHDRFCRMQLGIYPYVLRDAWDRVVYTGRGLAPTVVTTEAEMRTRVLATPGAVGYVTGHNTSSAIPYRLAAADQTGTLP